MKTAVVALASALALTACAGVDSSPKATTDPTAIVTLNGTEPQKPLIPTDTNEAGGRRIVNAVFAGLLTYSADGESVNDVADSITTDDSQHFVVTIAGDRVFSNGERVTARSFVDAWNFAARKSNAQLTSSFFADIRGFSYDEDTELTGLTVVSDTRFTIDLSAPVSDFPLRLGHSAFFPMPTVAYTDMEAFGENPIGNGPYMLAAANTWKHDESIELVANPSYAGPRVPKNGGLRYVFYASYEAAYADLLSRTLDVLDVIPDSKIASYLDDLDGRGVNQRSAAFQAFGIPASLEHFAGEEGRLRRQAISMAIDRAEITAVIYKGTRVPAKDFSSPTTGSWSATLPGSEVLEHNPKKAKQLWAEADRMSPWTGAFRIAYNADADHRDWVDAVANSIKNTLQIDAAGEPVPTLRQFRTAIVEKSMDSAFRFGLRGDYPGVQNYLGPIYGTRAAYNDIGYSNPEFDALIEKGLAQTDVAAANADFDAAQVVLLNDLPAIPLWYPNVTGGFGESVQHVTFAWNAFPVVDQITKTSTR
ncbi:peptide ABC transporter substrate-binding protein [Leifsonia sp. McL0607]|uniref:peptide ABC transporter substrate-binding protein n=1 Tax=Leifsonia sp. McL0607 TaxID=3415672 RepID=UPI003CF26B15